MIRAPRVARWLVGRLVPRRDRELFLGDLDEELAVRASAAGPLAARVWYWRQALHSLFPLARHRLVAPSTPASTLEGDPVWHDVVDDLRYAVRLAGRNRVASLAVIGTMVLGLGVTTAVFSVVNSVLLKPLPFDGSERVVRMGMTLRGGRFAPNMAYPDVQDYRRDARSFEAFSAVFLTGVTLTQGDPPRQLLVAYVDDGYARVFALRPALGRFFSPDEYRAGAPRVVMLSHQLWQRQFGGDPSIVGRAISLGNEPRVVVGVLPPSSYSYPFPGLDLLGPLVPREGTYQANRGALWLRAVGKMKPGVSLQQARSEIATIADRLAREYPDANGGLSVRIEPLHEVEVGDVHAMLVLLSASVVAVLLIACVNIANVLLGQSYARAREFAIRAALGGSGARVRRQVLTESMLLAVIGGMAGTSAAPLVTRGLIALYPGTLPRAEEIGVDVRVLVVAGLATLAAGVLAGLPSARRATRLNLTRNLRDSARTIGTAAQRRVSGMLVVSQVAMSLALLFSAGLLLRTFVALSNTDPGFVADGITTFQLSPSRARYPTTAAARIFYDAVRAALEALPGTRSVAMASEIPYNGNSSSDIFVPKERGDRGRDNPQVRIATVSAGYWSTLGVPLVAGRTFTAADDGKAPRVAVVNDALARRYYPGQSPVGRTIQFNTEEWEIIGVVGSMRMLSVVDAPEPELYLSDAQVSPGGYVIVKSPLPAAQLIPQIRAAIREIDPTVPLTEEATMDERISAAIAPQRFRAALIGGLGVLALLLSTLGVYGVVAYAVNRRTREIGIRMALGEDRGRVQRRVVLSAVRIAGIGAGLGVLLALAASRWLAAFLVGVEPRDPVMLGASALVLVIIAAAAAYVPARRASRVDPLVALRSE